MGVEGLGFRVDETLFKKHEHPRSWGIWVCYKGLNQQSEWAPEALNPYKKAVSLRHLGNQLVGLGC